MTFENETEEYSEPCNSPYCFACEYVVECDSVYSNTTDTAFKLCHSLDCNSINLIYLIQCKECDMQYIGQTRNSLRSRINNHKGDVIHCRNTTIGHHFNSNACMLEDLKFIPIYQCPELASKDETTKCRLEIEQYFIDSFKTYQPYGLNIAVKKHKDIPNIHFTVPYSNLGLAASKIVRSHYTELRKNHPLDFTSNFVCAYSRNKNLKDALVSAKIR